MYNVSPPAAFSDRGFVRVRICGQIIILYGIVGDDLLCAANISLKTHLVPLFHESISSLASTARFKRSLVGVIISSKDISFSFKGSYECHVLKVNARIRICSPHSSSRAKRVQLSKR